MELILYLQLFIIRPTLMYLEPEIRWSVAAEKLLLGTAAQESHLGDLVGGRKDLTMYQMEEATERDIWEHYLAFHQALAHKLRILRETRSEYYAAAMVRVHYWRLRNGSKPGTIKNISLAWKQLYNTNKGKGTRQQFISTYQNLVEGRLAIPLDPKSSSPASPVYVRGD